VYVLKTPDVAVMSFEDIEAMAFEDAAVLCRRHRLPDTGTIGMLRKRVRAVKMGGHEHYVSGMTICPLCGNFARRNGSIATGSTVIRYFVCTGRNQCRFTLAEGV